MILTSFLKKEAERDLSYLIPTEVNNYKNYMKWYSYPSQLKGVNKERDCSWVHNVYIYLDFNWENKLRFVRINFDTPTLDRITKDRAAKFVDIMSAIGGTMGLLTGFSIISGVEILYFAAKIIGSIIIKDKNKRRK